MLSKLSIISILINVLIASMGIGFLLLMLGATTVGGWLMMIGGGVALFGFALHV